MTDSISRPHALFAAMLFSAAFPVLAQEATFSTDVKVVTLLASVRDRDGRFIKDLTKDDFVLKEDGVQQTIKYFARESDLPLTIGLLVDTSRSQTEVLEAERSASHTFLDQVLRESVDQAFVVHFDEKVEVLQGPTSSRADLAAALGRLKIPGHYATLLFDAVKESSENQMRKQKGRKAFVVLSDGVAFRDPTSIGTAIEYAQRADTIIYTIRFADPMKIYRPGKAAVKAITGGHGKKALLRLADETGGMSFEVSKSEPLQAIYRKIEEALRNQYSLGYTSETASKSGQYHKIKLTTARKDLTIQTRDGYYSK